MENIILVGGGGHCRSIIDSMGIRYKIVGIFDIDKTLGELEGIKVYHNDNEIGSFINKGVRNAFVALGGIMNSYNREQIYTKLKKYGFNIPRIIDNTAIIARGTVLGEGVFIGKGVIINSGTTIGKCSIINSGSIVEHDCKISDFVHIAPGAVVCGGVQVGGGSHVGANATLIEGVTVKENVMIGAGSVVIGDLFKSSVYIGNPARLMKNE
ncbi:MAG: NeuD/PglB/VioB family sugar acetyltransferase [Clostridium sp.]